MSDFPDDSFSYSSGQNPNLNSFVKHNYLSQENIDDFWFSIQPLKRDYKEIRKTGPIYAMHRYWTKQPIDIISQNIQHYCPHQGIVLDPFCGTGTTGTAALVTNRKVVLSDLSPIATFVAKNYTETTDISILETIFQKIKDSMESKIVAYYSIPCETCMSSAEIKDWIYSDTYTCSVCNYTIPFIPDPISWEVIQNRKRGKFLTCPNCDNRFNRIELPFQDSIPVALRYQCKECKIRKKFKLLTQEDKEHLSNFTYDSNKLFIPKIKLSNGINTNQALLKNINYTHQFFSPLTAKFLSELWYEISQLTEAQLKSRFQFIFSSIVYRVTKLYRLRVKGQGGVLSGTLYVPPISQDINAWDVFIERFRKIKKGLIALNANLPTDFDKKRLISTQSAINLSIPSESIDYVYSDPPYGGNINYSELNLLWESWFNKITDSNEEIIINALGQNKSMKEYEQLLSAAFTEINRVLKKHAWFTLVFNTSSPNIWSLIQRVIQNSNFQINDNISTIESNMTTAKQTQSKVTARRFILINMKKRDFTESFSTFSESQFENLVISKIESFLLSHPSQQSSYDEIYDEIITRLLPKVKIKNFNLKEILDNNFSSFENQIWGLK